MGAITSIGSNLEKIGLLRRAEQPFFLFACELLFSFGITLVFCSLPFSSSNAIEAGGVVFALTGWVACVAVKRDLCIKGNPLNMLFVLFLATILLSFLTAYDLHYALNELRGEFLTYCLLFYAVVYFCQDRIMIYRLFTIFVFGNIVALVLYTYLLSHAGFQPSVLLAYCDVKKLYAEGTPKLSTYFLVCSCLIYSALYFIPSKKHLFGLLLLLVGNLFFMCLTYQRAVIIAMGCVLFVPLCFLRVISLRRYWLLGVVVLSLAVVVLFTPIKSKFSHEYWLSISQWQTESLNSENVDIRVKLIADFWYHFQDRLFMGAGYGKGNMAKMAASESGEYIGGADSHNTLLNTIAQLGLQGFVVLLGMIFVQGRLLWQGAHKAVNRFDRFVFVGIFCCMVGFWIRMVCNDLYRGAPALMYWILMGVAFGIWLSAKDEQTLAC